MWSWKEEYSVGVKLIDEQHKRFFSIINRLDDVIRLGGKREDTVRILTDLVSYANYHFAVEEKYFQEFKYKRAKVHTAMHNGFRAKVEDFVNRLEEEDPSLVPGMATFSRDWLISHILKEDKKYSETFLAHGLGNGGAKTLK